MRAAWLWGGVALLAVAAAAGAQTTGFRASDWNATWQRDDHPSQYIELDVDETDITGTIIASGDTVTRPVGSLLFVGTMSCIGGHFRDPYCPTAEVQYRIMWSRADADRCPAVRDGRTVRGLAQLSGARTLIIHIPRYVVKVSSCQVIHRGETTTTLHLVE